MKKNRHGRQDSPKRDVYAEITNRIVADLEKGVRPWMKPWSTKHAAGSIGRPLRYNGEAYRGINTIMLWATAIDAGYAAPIWMTCRQANQFDGQVRKGEKGTLVVFANTIQKTEVDEETGEDVDVEIPYMKGYTVFNVEQIDGLRDEYYALAEPVLDPSQRLSHAEAFFANLDADIRTGGSRAFYRLNEDFVQMPPFEAFRDVEAYYAVLGHETCHWTRHRSRLDRSFGRKRWGDEGYAMEECVAELGSAFLAADLGLYLEPREDHAAYIESWLKILKGNKRAIFSAASHAQKAVDFLHQQQGSA